ncbi:MAG TPA: hypothetical protein VNM92_14235 [Thermoanaerobaculia bacterium]|nr:hypothetical protein [Thermoanaerobaculia bacterium]
MSPWLIEVSGDRFDTDEIAYWFPSGDVFGVELDGGIYLTGPGLDQCISAAEAREYGAAALDEFAAAISVLSPKFVKPEVGSVILLDDEGRRHATVFAMAASITVRAKAHGTLEISGQTQPAETQGQRLIRTVRERSHLMTAASLWSEANRSWPRLYRILEEIESDLGQTVNRARFCSRNERQRFTQSANSAEIAGKDARHARSKFDIADDPMTLSEALTFIHGLLQKAVQRREVRPSRQI